MKPLVIFISMLFIVECKSNDRKSSSKHRNNEIISKILYDTVASTKIESDSLYITFQASFHNDTVKAMIGKTIIFKNIISTDQSIGLAESIGIYKNQYASNKDKCIQIIINKSAPIQICNYNGYKFMLIDKIENFLKIKLTNKIPYYK